MSENKRSTKHHQLKRKMLLFSLVVLAVAGHSQLNGDTRRVGYTSLSAYSKHFIDALSFTSNQAVLASLKTPGAGVYAERKFLLKEMSFYTIAACLPVQFGGVGVSAKYFGYDAYKEMQLGVGYGKNLGKIDMGIQANYLAVHIPGYGKDALITIEGGVILRLSEQLYAGMHVFNPTGSKFGENHLEKLSAAYTAGVGYEASEKVMISAEILKEEDKPVDINAGLQYVLSRKFFTRLGLFTGTARIYFGFGWKWNDVRIEATTSYHRQLGFTPGLMLLFQRNDEKD